MPIFHHSDFQRDKKEAEIIFWKKKLFPDLKFCFYLDKIFKLFLLLGNYIYFGVDLSSKKCRYAINDE